MNREDDIIAAEAAAWHVASFTDEMDWDDFVIWLEADPRHREAYDEVALADSLAAAHGHVPVEQHLVANDTDTNDEVATLIPAARTRIWRVWAGSAIAASLAALVVMPQLMSPAPRVYVTQRAMQTVALDDGSHIVVAPYSRLEVGGKHQDQLALTGGAWFNIRHDPSRQMEIAAGELTIGDIGTSFDVQAAEAHVRIEVAEGQVAVTSERMQAPVRLSAGRALAFDGKRGTSAIMPLNAKDAGEWRHGRLTYDSAPLALVAEDLRRYAGVKVTVPRELSDRQFSGTLMADNGEAALRDLSQLMGLELRAGGDTYSLSE